MTRGETVRTAAFVFRCGGGAWLAYVLAGYLGLPMPVWAAISCIVVSQEALHDTRNAVWWRLLGTLLGITLAVAVGSLVKLAAGGIAAQIGGAVAACALLAHYWPGLRVSMWTVPIIYLAQTPDIPLATAGLWRATEVVFGAAVGAVLHWLVDFILNLTGADPARK